MGRDAALRGLGGSNERATGGGPRRRCPVSLADPLGPLPYHLTMTEPSNPADPWRAAGPWHDHPAGALMREFVERGRTHAIGLVFSALVDADFLDTEAFMSPERAATRFGSLPAMAALDTKALR